MGPGGCRSPVLLLSLVAFIMLEGVFAETEEPEECTAASCAFSFRREIGSTLFEFDLRKACPANAGPVDFYESRGRGDDCGNAYRVNFCGNITDPCGNDTMTDELPVGAVVQRAQPIKGRPDRPCTVLAVGSPTWTVLDSENPRYGGVVGSFAPVPIPPNYSPGQTQCSIPARPAAGARFWVSVEISCLATSGPKTTMANEAKLSTTADGDVLVTLSFASTEACANIDLSFGWLLVALALLALATYTILGMAVVYKREGLLAFPHRHQWSRAYRDAIYGCVLVGYGCRVVGLAVRNAIQQRRTPLPICPPDPFAARYATGEGRRG